MIRVEAVRIEEFRGIRELDLDLGQKSFVVLGPNGSGKSGVVDAIDFALTGNVARLSGAGTGGVTLLKHGPHVHKRDDPVTAKVALTICDVESGQTAVLTRCVKTASQYSLDPTSPELEAAVAWAAKHPELTLSRREVMKYVNTEPGKRAQEVQSLLKLDRIDETRRLLRSALTKTAGLAKQSAGQAVDAEDRFRRHLDVNELLVSEVAAAVNKHRATLGLEALESVTADTDLSAGAAVSGDAPASAYNKISALRDIDALAGYLAEHPGLAAAAGDLSASLEELESDPTILDALEHRQLIEVGLPLVVDGSCPLCDHIWPDAEDLRVHLQGKLARSDAANALKKRTNAATQRVVTELQRARALVETALPHATTVGRTEDHAALLGWSNELAGFEAHLGGLETIRPHAQRLREDPLAVPASLTKSLGALRLAIESLPDQSAADSARTALTIAQERSTHLRQARAGSSKAAAVHETAESVYQAYTEVADQSLLTLYQTVQDRFSEFYSRINADDESSFKAGLTPSSGKLDFDVDFYGLGMFPPTAYHSEGHQDGMGVCLYLALIEQLLQDDFRLAVLDDVVTSVDVNHRREFCKLLKEGFPDVQFIITTHDEVWARLMQSSGLIGRKSLGRFHGWSVDGGPVYAQSGNAWSQIENDLAEDDVPGAAHKLRRSLEASMADIAANLRASVVYRPDNSYELGALFAAAKRRHGDLLKRAADAASSWNDEEAKQRVDALKAERAKAMLAQDDENWAINALVHNNDWANMTKADFAPVVEACKQFSELFACTNDGCDSLIYLVGGPGAEEALRCSCGKLNLNLRRKK